MLEFTWGLITKAIGLKLFLQYLHGMGEVANGNGRENVCTGSSFHQGLCLLSSGGREKLHQSLSPGTRLLIWVLLPLSHPLALRALWSQG